MREALAPVQNAFSTASQWVTESVGAVGSFPRLHEENRELRRNVARLEAELFALRSVQAQNVRLREMLDLKPHLPAQSVVARVVARPTEHWFAHITINRGRSDGLRAGLPVVDERGIVGQVESVTPQTARVILLVDPKSAVGGVVVGTDEPVLVEGIGDPTGQRASVQPLVRDSGLTVGDEVVTSGLSRVFPKGLPIGRVVEVARSEGELRSQGILQPYVDFARLDWVSVIVDPSAEVLWPWPRAASDPLVERSTGDAIPHGDAPIEEASTP